MTGTKDILLSLPDGTKQTVHRMEFEQKPFAGITFTVYDARTDQPVTSFVSADDGVAVSELLSLEDGAEYYVKETGTPAGLVQSAEKYKVEFNMFDKEDLSLRNSVIEIMNEALKRNDFKAYNVAKSMLEETIEDSKQEEALLAEMNTNNFGILNHIFEQQLPTLIKSNKKAVRDVIKTIKEDKNLLGQFNFYKN